MCCLGATLLYASPTLAAQKPLSGRVVWMGFGGGGGVSGGDVSGVGYLNFTFGLRLLPVVPEFSLRDGLRGTTGVDTHVGGVAIGARFLLPRLLIARGYFRLAFSQQHEIPWDRFLEAPLQSVFGFGEGLSHRSGFEGGGGVEIKLGPKGIVGLWAQGTVLVFPESAGPPVTAVVEAGLSLALGPKIGGG